MSTRSPAPRKLQRADAVDQFESGAAELDEWLRRSAVDRGSVGSGLGAALFLDALRRALRLSESVGARAVLIHARDESAREFYLHLADCLQSPVDDLQLMIPMKDLARVLGTQG